VIRFILRQIRRRRADSLGHRCGELVVVEGEAVAHFGCGRLEREGIQHGELLLGEDRLLIADRVFPRVVEFAVVSVFNRVSRRGTARAESKAEEQLRETGECWHGWAPTSGHRFCWSNWRYRPPCGCSRHAARGSTRC